MATMRSGLVSEETLNPCGFRCRFLGGALHHKKATIVGASGFASPADCRSLWPVHDNDENFSESFSMKHVDAAETCARS